MDVSPILSRILQESEGADLFEVLAEGLSPTDLQSLLLEVYRRRATRVTPTQLLSSYEQNPYVRPAVVKPETTLQVDLIAFSLLSPLFDWLEFSPVCPLGTCSAVATVDQNKTLSTVRNTEVVSDPTNVLALECATRRRALLKTAATAHQRVRLYTSQRVVRPQRFQGPASFAHFRLLTLCTAGRDEGSFRFELETLYEQLLQLVTLLSALRETGFTIGPIRIGITDLSEGVREAALETQVIAPLQERFPELSIGFAPERTAGRGYYTDACFALYITDSTGTEYMLADGGFTDWTQKLLSNRKERLLIGGLGTERLAVVFCPQGEK
ncbi:MAG: hypothetical protein QM758_10625 [Armatimonas sp.]